MERADTFQHGLATLLAHALWLHVGFGVGRPAYGTRLYAGLVSLVAILTRYGLVGTHWGGLLSYRHWLLPTGIAYAGQGMPVWYAGGLQH